MDILRKFFRIAFFKSIWVNFYCLPFLQAIKFPIVLARGVRIFSLHRGAIQFVDNQKFVGGGLRIGFQDAEYSYYRKSVLNIQGTLILKGKGFHSFSPGLSLIIAEGATVEIGNNFSSCSNTRISIFKSLKIGDDNMWSFENVIMDTDTHIILNENDEKISFNSGITFGDHVWLGCRNTVLKGVTIPNGSIIGACGVVTKPFTKENSIYVGNKMIKSNIKWNRSLNY